MHPIICQIGPFAVYSYGLMLALAFIIASRLAMAQAKRKGIRHVEVISGLCLVAVISGIIGARIFYVLENLEFYLEHPLESIMLQHGGLSWFGGFILGTFCAVFYLKIKKFSVLRALDLLAPFIALAQAIGRIGCLLNGCCYGRPSAFGIYFPVHDAALIPTQIYSSLIALSIFVYLRICQDSPGIKEGEVFFTYLLLYPAGRFFIEFWRADNPVILWGLSLFQLISIALFAIALAALAAIKKNTSGE